MAAQSNAMYLFKKLESFMRNFIVFCKSCVANPSPKNNMTLAVAKRTNSYSSDLHFLQNLRFTTLEAYNMFDNKFDLYRSEVCPDIEKITQ